MLENLSMMLLSVTLKTGRMEKPEPELEPEPEPKK